MKGGHLDGDPVDILWEAGTVTKFSGQRINASMRGTGCVLAAAIAAHVAQGATVATAVERARAYLREKLITAESVGPLRVFA